MIAYKGFRPGLVCLGYQFQMGRNVTEEANCTQNGFHCAEDPLDCLKYYSNLKGSVYCLVRPGGDIDEDAVDSKIACTELTIIKQLEPEEFFLHALAYMVDHPARKRNFRVRQDRAKASDGYAVVTGADPLASGRKGDVLAFAKEDPVSGKILQVAVATVGQGGIKPEIWYDIDFQERTAEKV